MLVLRFIALIPGPGAALSQLDTIGQHGQGFRGQAELLGLGIRALGPPEGALFQALESGSTLPQEAILFIMRELKVGLGLQAGRVCLREPLL